MRKTLLSLVITGLLSSVSMAAVVVIDPESIAKSVEMIKHANTQINELKEQVATAKGQLEAYKQEVLDTKKRLEGFTDYSAIFGSAEAYMQDFWKDMDVELKETDIRKLADKYGFDVSEYEQIEKQYKEKFEQVQKYETLEKNIKGSAQRLSAAQKAFKNAKTPQQREELNNNILVESSVMQAQIAQADAEIKKSEKEQKLKAEAALRKYASDNFALPSKG